MTESIKFLVQGSASDPYQVEFHRDGMQIAAFCLCQAGVHRKLCKHVLRILSDNLENMSKALDSDTHAQLLRDWVVECGLGDVIREWADAQDGFEHAKARHDQAKKRLSSAVNLK